MRYIFVLLSIIIMVEANSQSFIAPPNAIPGKCYSTCYEENQISFSIDTISYDIYVGNARKSSKKRKELKYYDTDEFGKLIIEDGLENNLANILGIKTVKKNVYYSPKEQIGDTNYTTTNFTRISSRKPQLDTWREVLCNSKINEALILDIQVKLFDLGYLKNFEKGKLDDATNKAITGFQRHHKLIIVPMSIETLKALEIKIPREKPYSTQ